jgi:sugar porter (SP) family MFS transporter
MKWKVLFCSLVIALSGFLFGFDTAVISGAEQSIQQFWALNAFELGLTVSIALVGTVLGSLIGYWPADHLGRRPALFLVGACFLVASLGTALTSGWTVFLVFRLLGGLSVGASSVIAPIYISELAPQEHRGQLVALFQFNVVLGIGISYLSNFLIGRTDEHSWRLMLGIQTIPSALLLLLLKFVPESPRWLILKNRSDEARTIFASIGTPNPDAVIAEIQKANQSVQPRRLFSGHYRTPILLATAFAMFNQVSGINAIIYYAPRIFEMTGLGPTSSLLTTAGLGGINFLFTLLAMNFIDKVGRKTLMYIGSVGTICTLALVSYSFYTKDFNDLSVPVFLFIYIAFFAFSQGAVIWVFISEIFPTDVRAKGQMLGSTTHWAMAALISFLFPFLAEQVGGGNTFLFFCGMMCLQLLFVWKWMPETKGISLEQISSKISINL